MKDVKFKYYYKGFPFSSTDDGFSWHKKIYSLPDIEGGVINLSNFEKTLGNLVGRFQFTGIKDMCGVELYRGDIVNIYYESNEFIFDGKYVVELGVEGVSLRFVGLMWESHGYNQTPYEKLELAGHGGILTYDYNNDNKDTRLCISRPNKFRYSNYIKKIGSVLENPYLLESN